MQRIKFQGVHLLLFSTLLVMLSRPLFAADYTIDNNTNHYIGSVIIDLDNSERRTIVIDGPGTSYVDIGTANVVSVTINNQTTSVGNTNVVSLPSSTQVEVEVESGFMGVIDLADT